MMPTIVAARTTNGIHHQDPYYGFVKMLVKTIAFALLRNGRKWSSYDVQEHRKRQRDGVNN